MKTQEIAEAGLVLNKNDGAYPKNNNILILAGGAGSGKSFILENLILFEGKIFNVDNAKAFLRIYGKKRPNGKLAQQYKQIYGYELKDIDFKNNQHVSDIHDFVTKFRLAFEPQALFFKAASTVKNKPNVIFDMTLKQINRLELIGEYAAHGGYDPKNVHIVWVLNDVKMALDQNAKRERVEPKDLLVATHNGAAKTMKDIFDYSEHWKGIIDGDIWIVFNKKNVDIKTKININRDDLGNKSFTMEIEDYISIHMKERGKPSKKFKDIEKPLMDKILEYVPDEAKAYLTKN